MTSWSERARELWVLLAWGLDRIAVSVTDDRKALGVLIGIVVLFGSLGWWLTSGSDGRAVHRGVPSPTVREAAQRFATTLTANDSHTLRTMVSEDNVKESVLPDILDKYGGRPVRAVKYEDDENDGNKFVLFEVGCRSGAPARFEVSFEWQDTDRGSGWVMWSGSYIHSHGGPTECVTRRG